MHRRRESGTTPAVGVVLDDHIELGPPEAPLDYPLGKAARHWLTRTLAPREFSRGITINAVAPGPTERFTFEEAIAAVRGEGTKSGNTPQTIAEVVAFLCGDAAVRVTGAVIPVPGDRAV